MPTLLHVDASPLSEHSITRRLSSEFVEGWRLANPHGEVITRDLTTTKFTGIDAQWVQAVYSAPDSRTPEQNQLLALSDSLIAELERAEEWIFGVPMHNFTVPTVFRLWLDQVVRAGRTFSYINGSPIGLLKNKKAFFVTASGGRYDPESITASFDFVQPYLRCIFGFIGVAEMSFHSAGGTAALAYGDIDRHAFLEPHIQAIRAQVQTV